MASEKDSHLLEFYGTECFHCNEIRPTVEKLEKELKVKIKRIEVWHNAKNAELMQKYDQGRCGGVPFFYNTKTNKSLCGAVDKETLKKWMLGK
ncbi:MAG: hypothetical protein HYS32_00680 [Candidatus Woesearchaeota archaeon]|nr:MAG: hypothetical protein HYS32_00680 [Candidatus Woesearchaeota archaeon]